MLTNQYGNADITTTISATPAKKTNRRPSVAQLGDNLTGMVVKIARQFGAGRQFTQSEAWDMLDRTVREKLMTGYGSRDRAIAAFRHAFANAQHHGVARVSRGRYGTSVYVYRPPSTAKAEANGHIIGEQMVFVAVGTTSDGGTLFRNDQTGEVGWVTWEAL